MIRSAAIVFLAIWLLSLLIFRAAGFNDPGTFWHTRVGEIILDTGTFPRTDPFTFPFEGQLWIPQQWLAEVIMALLYRSAGMDGQLLALAPHSSPGCTPGPIRDCDWRACRPRLPDSSPLPHGSPDCFTISSDRTWSRFS